jgi:hypothetical protein
MSLGTQTAPFTRKIAGVISGNDETLILYSPNSASATITVEGTFDGVLNVTGAINEGGTEGERILFRSGVGSSGLSKITGADGTVPREYRIVCGGDYVIIRGSSWASGSASIHIHTQEAPNIVFANGPIHGPELEAVRSERGFIASTGPQPVESGNVLVTTIQNPADSGVNLFLTDRIFGNSSGPTATNLEYAAYANPTYLPTTTGNGFNRKRGFPVSTSSFNYEVRSITGLDMGGSLGTGAILPNGFPYDLQFEFILPPGNGLGFIISGAGQNVGQAVRVSIGFIWYEEEAV